MKRTKRVWSLVLVFVMVCGVAFANLTTVNAASKRPDLDYPGLYAYDGKCIYYTATDFGGDGLRKYDPKTQKSTVVVNWSKFNNRTLAELAIKGEYIYFLANTSTDRYGNDSELFRVKKNGTGLKSLKAHTEDFVIAGNKIYYIKTQVEIGPGQEGRDAECDEESGKIVMMNLDGSQKKTVKKYDPKKHSYQLAVYKGALAYGEDLVDGLCMKTLKGTIVDFEKVAKAAHDKNDSSNEIYEGNVYSNGYKYYVNDNGSFCRSKDGSEKSQTIISNEKRGRVFHYRICGDYIMGMMWNNNFEYEIFCVKINGKNYKTLHRRVAAG